jgi:hypothetical protein
MAVDIHLSQLSNGEKLSDGDVVKMTIAPGLIPQDRIGIALRLDGVTWWKGLQSGDIVLCQAQDSQNFISTQLSVSDFKSGGLQLWKAKTFGVHTQMYNVVDATDQIAGGQSYLFTWSRD